MARQSFHQRLGPQTTAFLFGVPADLTEQHYQPAATEVAGGPIRRFLIKDATTIALPKSNVGTFPANGNRHGDTAGVEIDFTFDLLSFNIIFYTPTSPPSRTKPLPRSW